jgi:hypothetical protein
MHERAIQLLLCGGIHSGAFMAIQRRYEVIRVGTTFTQFGPSPETVVSTHKSYDAAKRSFNAAHGSTRLVEICGNQRKVLDAAIC